MNFDGIYPPVITPYHDDHSVDEAGFISMIEYLIDADVHGIVVGGTTGEYYAQTFDERVRLMQIAQQVIAGRLPMIAGASGIRTEDCIALAQAARDCGADALLLGSPYYAVPTEQELAEHTLAIEQAAKLPVVLYNYPGRTGAMMGEEFLRQVSNNKNICAIKESSGDINRVHVLSCNYPSIALLCGMDDQALEFFAWGARGWICAGANFLPQPHCMLYQAMVVDNDVSRGRAIMAALLPLMVMLEQGGKFVQSIKYACELNGLSAGPVRKPLQELTAVEKQQVEQVVAEVRAAIDNLACARAA